MAGERVKALRAATTAASGAPGEVLDGLTIACGEGAVQLLDVQRAGKKAGSADDFLRGNPIPSGTVLD
jgi:methionyl-tRNA formyltransferase